MFANISVMSCGLSNRHSFFFSLTRYSSPFLFSLQVDPFHTLFGIAGLSLLQHDTENIKAIDPVYCLPSNVIQRIGIKLNLL